MQIINNTPKLNSQNAKFALDLAKENYNGSAAILSSIEEEIAAAKLNFKMILLIILDKKIYGIKILVLKQSMILKN